MSTAVDRLITTLLHEGYALYPYRASALKNRMRFTFGTLYPRSYTEHEGSDRSSIALELPIRGNADTRLVVDLIFLLVVETGNGPDAWQQGIEQRVRIADGTLAAFRASESIVIERGSVRAAADIRIDFVRDGIHRLHVDVENCTWFEPLPSRRTALAVAMASTHLLVHASGGEVVSLLDPPAELGDVVASCRSSGVFPVLVGNPERRDTMLASPITLYDYPMLAPESPGDLYDATEIDEILTLRVLTLTDAERAELAKTDPRVQALLERTAALSPAELERMHGRIRSDRTALVPAPGGAVRIGPGDRVRLRPRRRADAFDLLLDGKMARVEAVEQDFDDRLLVAVTLEDDPGRDLGGQGLPGHRFFFHPEEVEKAP